MNILLTGGSGFLGRRLAAALHARPDVSLTAVLRCILQIPATQIFEVKGLETNPDLSMILRKKHTVVHTAARAHIVKDEVPDAVGEYRRVNVDATLNLARQSAEAGVKRFVFVSSIGVNGNSNTKPFTEADTPSPDGLYAESKWEAEQGLWEIQGETGMELVIIRSPLVYGRKAPGNFGRLMRWVQIGVPLPFGAIHNRRSLVSVDNLVDLIITCIGHPAAANQIFLAGDGQDLSTTELLRGVATAMNKPSRLVPVPSSFLMFAATLFGKKAVAQRLLGSLQVDISKARELLGWEPPISVEEGLRRCFIKE